MPFFVHSSPGSRLRCSDVNTSKRLLYAGGCEMNTSDPDSTIGGVLRRSLRRRRAGSWARLALFAACLSSVPQIASAQAVYGSVFGTITDSSGAVVPNATVTVTNVAKG